MPPVSKDRVADCNGVLDKTPSTVIIKQSIDMPHSVNKKVISTTKNVKGYFDAELPVGTYNIYVVFDGKEYYNHFGGQLGQECEFSVTANNVTPYDFVINTASD